MAFCPATSNVGTVAGAVYLCGDNSYLFMDTSEPEVCAQFKHRGRPIKGYCYSPDDAGEVG